MAVTVYTTPTCPFCQQVKMYLAQRGVPFREV
ncbi:MAG: glutaredoxin family protein, partial [Anaerolineae bacterium]|nr:glutaredoxin family protein [Anaerolineae bacterium]